MVEPKSVCCRCPRLTQYRTQVKKKYPDYHCLPVEASGATSPKLLIVGLAPGLHGANASGLPFTGDASGQLLFETLHKFGYASSPSSDAQQPMTLQHCRVTNAVKCLPPENKPTTDEVNTCNFYLRQEIEALQADSIVLALGTIAHRAVLKTVDVPLNHYRFEHDKFHLIDGGLRLVDSYHCSRYNIQTGRLTRQMFEKVFQRISTIQA